jgi:hypothetical protein
MGEFRASAARFRWIAAAVAILAGCGSEHREPSGSPAPIPKFAWDECALETGYAGDDACILPPPPDKGFQVHVGPADYENPGPECLLGPGEEKTSSFFATSGNEQDVFFFYRQYRVRPGTHHLSLITPDNMNPAEPSFHTIGVANASQDFPSGGIIAPEDRGVGMPLAARSPIEVNLHAINTTGEPALREAWVNVWYRDPNEISQPAVHWFKDGEGVDLAIQPRQAVTLGPRRCRVEGDGRLLWLYGHRHANNVRFAVWRVRGMEREIVYDAYNWQEPLRLEYSSLIENPAPDAVGRVDGGWSGILALTTGDQLEWQCDVVNRQDTVLRPTNETYLGEMCIVDAEAVGAVKCVCPESQAYTCYPLENEPRR